MDNTTPIRDILSMLRLSYGLTRQVSEFDKLVQNETGMRELRKLGQYGEATCCLLVNFEYRLRRRGTSPSFIFREMLPPPPVSITVPSRLNEVLNIWRNIDSGAQKVKNEEDVTLHYPDAITCAKASSPSLNESGTRTITHLQDPVLTLGLHLHKKLKRYCWKEHDVPIGTFGPICYWTHFYLERIPLFTPYFEELTVRKEPPRPHHHHHPCVVKDGDYLQNTQAMKRTSRIRLPRK